MQDRTISNDWPSPEENVNVKCRACGSTYGYPNVVVVASGTKNFSSGDGKVEVVHGTCPCGAKAVFRFTYLGTTVSVFGEHTDLTADEVLKFMGGEKVGDNEILALQWSLWRGDFMDRVRYHADE